MTSDHPLAAQTVPPTAASNAASTAISKSTGRLLIVANRLPLSMSIKRAKEASGQKTSRNEITFTTSSGGLVSALKGCDMSMRWIGWPGGEVNGEEDRKAVIEKLDPMGSIPVFLPAKVCDLFYNGFCNNLLWPLFHYIPIPVESIHEIDSQFKAYRSANIEFAKAVLREYKEGDVVWIHDYHLMLLPLMLRQVKPEIKLGFFFHTPFPSSEIYRVLPCRAELLQGVLACNLIGFHTHDYGRHFQSACTRICGAHSSGDTVKLNGQISGIGTFPIGIDPLKFSNSLKTDAVLAYIADLKSKFAGRKVLLGIDRLDYIKGITHKLYAFEKFLDENPKWMGKCVLIQIAVPSRTDVPEYQKLKAYTHELVGRVNGKYGSLHSLPVHYLDQSIPFDRMVALYRVADAMLITSVRDGMNLVAYEYIAAQENNAGVLILSEFAGAAQSLGAGALQINPWNINEVSQAILTAFTMSEQERRERINYCFNHVITHTAKAWARDFVKHLNETQQLQQLLPSATSAMSDLESVAMVEQLIKPSPKYPLAYTAHCPESLSLDQVSQHFSVSKHRVIITGLSGLLASFQEIARLKRDGSLVYESVANDGENTDYGASDSFVYGAVGQILQPQRSETGTDAPVDWNEIEREGLEESIEENTTLQQLQLDDTIVKSVRDDLVRLAADANTTVIVLTTLSREWCDLLFAGSDVWCCAENGYYVKLGAQSIWQCSYEAVSLTWKSSVKKVFEYFTERTPKSLITEGETLMSWHYNLSEPIFAKRQANDLISHLTGGPLTNTYTEVVDSQRLIQVRPLGQSKGRAVKHLLQYLVAKQAKLTRPRRNRINSIALSHQPQDESSSDSDEEFETQDLNDQSAASEQSVHASPLVAASSVATVEALRKPPSDHSNSPLPPNVNPKSDVRRVSNPALSLLEMKLATPVDFILCCGGVLERDEDMFEVFQNWCENKQLPFNLQASQVNSQGIVTPRLSIRRDSQSGLSNFSVIRTPKQTLTSSSMQRITSFGDLSSQSAASSPCLQQRRLSVDTFDSSGCRQHETPKPQLESNLFSPFQLNKDADPFAPLTLPQSMSSRSNALYATCRSQLQDNPQQQIGQPSAILQAAAQQQQQQQVQLSASVPSGSTSTQLTCASSNASSQASSTPASMSAAASFPPHHPNAATAASISVPSIFTCTIGQHYQSKAKYFVQDVQQLNHLIKRLAQQTQTQTQNQL